MANGGPGGTTQGWWVLIIVGWFLRKRPAPFDYVAHEGNPRPGIDPTRLNDLIGDLESDRLNRYPTIPVAVVICCETQEAKSGMTISGFWAASSRKAS